jgi:acyl carrier protein phosphodiesterase
MNLLTKFFLAQKEEKYLVGGIMGEKLKNNRTLYSDEIVEGIVFTQKIKSFFSLHPAFQASQRRIMIQPKYSEETTKLVYDHLLAVNWKLFSNEEIISYCMDNFALLTKYVPYLVYSNKKVLNVFLETGGFNNIHTLGGLDKYTKAYGKIFGKVYFNQVMPHVIKNYSELNRDFLIFFPELLEYAKGLKEPKEYYMLRKVQ